MAPPVEEPSTGGSNLDVVNQSGETICYLYIATASQSDWGPDQLGAENVITAGDTFTITDIPPGTYDLKTEDCARNVISWNYGVNVDGSSDLTLTVGGSADQLLVDNTSSLDICRVFVSPTTEANWTRPQVDLDTPIPAGTSRTIAVVAGTWDLRVDPCGGGDPITRLGENLGSGTFTWTITD